MQSLAAFLTPHHGNRVLPHNTLSVGARKVVRYNSRQGFHQHELKADGISLLASIDKGSDGADFRDVQKKRESSMYESLVKKSEQYRGWLSSAEIAGGINAAKRNALRLVNDARLLNENGRAASATALAILAIEESGKITILRLLALMDTDKDVAARWREYRSHKDKNAHWPLLDLFFKGARRLDDFLPMFDPTARHPQILDTVKQLCLYTDSFGKGRWTEPDRVIEKKLADSFVLVAEVFARSRDVTAEEIDLWVQYLKPVWNVGDAARNKALLEWDKEMRRRGLITAEHSTTMETFMTTGVATPKPEPPIPQ
jgi:AbiV family abortive infection protein